MQFLAARTASTVLGRYATILADPAWKFEVWDRDTGQGRSAEAHYHTTEMDRLRALPVSELAARDAVLLMWSTWPHLPEALALGAAWGFTYKTAAWVWVKRSGTGRYWATGMGYWSRANTEPCLLFTRGNPRRLSRGIHQLILDVGQQTLWPPIVAPVGDHSAKPHEQYAKTERLLAGPYVELFARNTAPGWDCWGHEAPNCIDWQRYA